MVKVYKLDRILAGLFLANQKLFTSQRHFNSIQETRLHRATQTDFLS